MNTLELQLDGFRRTIAAQQAILDEAKYCICNISLLHPVNDKADIDNLCLKIQTLLEGED